MFSDWKYKVVARPRSTTIGIIQDNVKGMSAKDGDFPAESTLHGRLGGGLYAYAYQIPIEHVTIYLNWLDQEELIERWRFGTLLKHKPKNESIWHSFTAVDVSTRVDEDIIAELPPDDGEDLIAWIKENWQSYM